MSELREFWAGAADTVGWAFLITGALGVLLLLWLLHAAGVPL